MNIFHIFVVLLNYFWLSDDPDESASWYCDQHCFKLGAEVIESVWDSVLILDPEATIEADKQGIPNNNRKKRHSHTGGLWHPFSVWNGYCRANMRRSLINAEAIFKEHKRRTGKEHSAWTDCKFLFTRVDNINFNSNTWVKWFFSQNGTSGTYAPTKTKPADLKRRREWILEQCLLYRKDIDRNTCKMTIPGQYINEKMNGGVFEGCKVLKNGKPDVIASYRNYYIAKASTVKGGIRYYYTKPPKWLIDALRVNGNVNKLLTVPKSKRSIAKKRFETSRWLLDSEGFAVVRFIKK